MTLSPANREFAEEMGNHEYRSASAYVDDLIRQDRRRRDLYQPPVSVEEGEFILEYAKDGRAELERGQGIPWTPELVEAIKQSIRAPKTIS